MWDAVYPYVAALLPTIGISFLCYVVVRHVMEADRRERRAQAQWDAAHPRRPERRPKTTTDRPSGGTGGASPDE
jgi:hypothetical protein